MDNLPVKNQVISSTNFVDTPKSTDDKNINNLEILQQKAIDAFAKNKVANESKSINKQINLLLNKIKSNANYDLKEIAELLIVMDKDSHKNSYCLSVTVGNKEICLIPPDDGLTAEKLSHYLSQVMDALNNYEESSNKDVLQNNFEETCGDLSGTAGLTVPEQKIIKERIEESEIYIACIADSGKVRVDYITGKYTGENLLSVRQDSSNEQLQHNEKYARDYCEDTSYVSPLDGNNDDQLYNGNHEQAKIFAETSLPHTSTKKSNLQQTEEAIEKDISLDLRSTNLNPHIKTETDDTIITNEKLQSVLSTQSEPKKHSTESKESAKPLPQITETATQETAKNLLNQNMPIQQIDEKKPKNEVNNVTINIVNEHKDITSFSVDALVYGSNSTLKNGSGTCGVINGVVGEAQMKKLAKEALKTEGKEKLDPGDVVTTPAWGKDEQGVVWGGHFKNSELKDIVHAHPFDLKKIEQKHRVSQMKKLYPSLVDVNLNSLKKSAEKKYSSIAMCLLGEGSYGWDYKYCIKAIKDAVIEFRKEYPNYQLQIYVNIYNVNKKDKSAQNAEEREQAEYADKIFKNMG